MDAAGPTHTASSHSCGGQVRSHQHAGTLGGRAEAWRQVLYLPVHFSPSHLIHSLIDLGEMEKTGML